MRRRGAMVSGLVALGSLAVLAAAAAAEAEVRLERRGDGRLVASSLPPVLGEKEVERYLRSGLTTTFLLRVGAASPALAAARVEIRYELWDEEFLIAVLDGTGAERRLRQPSAEALANWWRELEIGLLGPGGRRSLPASVRVTLDLIPFSQREQDDAQRWLAESIGRSANRPRPGGDSVVGRAVGALIATSIQRRAAESWSWRVTIETRPKE